MNRFLKNSMQKRRVLVVDDEVINRELLEAVLSLNYDVTSVMNGSEAMNTLRAAKEPFSLILLDLLMPEKSGFQVLEECKADDELKKIPIIVMTTEKSAEVRSIRMGAEDFIPKPYRMPEVIIARCERIIELSEEKALIRSIEKDPLTELYIKLFFDAYINRLQPSIGDNADAIFLCLDGLSEVEQNYGEAEKTRLVKKIGGLMKTVLIKSKGIGCRMDDDTFRAYCIHRENNERLLARMHREFSDELQKYNISLRAGICTNVDGNEPPDVWFDRAREASKIIGEDAE